MPGGGSSGQSSTRRRRDFHRLFKPIGTNPAPSRRSVAKQMFRQNESRRPGGSRRRKGTRPLSSGDDGHGSVMTATTRFETATFEVPAVASTKRVRGPPLPSQRCSGNVRQVVGRERPAVSSGEWKYRTRPRRRPPAAIQVVGCRRRPRARAKAAGAGGGLRAAASAVTFRAGDECGGGRNRMRSSVSEPGDQ